LPNPPEKGASPTTRRARCRRSINPLKQAKLLSGLERIPGKGEPDHAASPLT